METIRNIVAGDYAIEIAKLSDEDFTFLINGKETGIVYAREDAAISGAVSFVIQNYYVQKK